MPVSVICTGCGKKLRVSEAKRGKQVKCPVCAEVVRVPEQQADDDFDTDDGASRSARSQPKKRRKKKSSGANGLAVPIGIAVAVVVVLGIGFAISRSGFNAGPATASTSEQNLNVASISPPTSDREITTTTKPLQSVPDNASESPAEQPPVPEMTEAQKAAEAARASDEFFTQGAIPELRIEISESELEKLNAGPRTFVIGAPRPYVQGTIHEDGKTTYQNVSIKLKGSAGSYRPFDDRPALSINVAKVEKDQTFHGMSKFHLNNSVQDDTYLHEWLCEELFRSAKLPATRVTHARVWLNDRDAGLYVLKSAFDKSFLRQHFGNAKGNLYEGGFLQDIDVELEKDAGKGPDDHSDLIALRAACREPDPDTRWKKIDELLNVDQFISFMAMELMTGHWDGYTVNHNNYRLYFDATSEKAHFLPHGMDQMFGNASASVIELPSSIVGSTVMQNAEWRARFRSRIGEFLTLFSPTDNLLQRVDFANERLRPVLAKMNPQVERDHDDRVKKLKERIVARVENLLQQHSQSDPKPREFDENGRLMLTDWKPVSESQDATLEVVDLTKGVRAYSIRCGNKGPCNASWRCKTLLAKGTYVLHATLRTNAVSASDEKGRAVGAGIRVSGMDRTNARKGNASRTPVVFEFNVMEEVRNVEIVAELIARRGQVLFEVDSLHLTRKSE